MINKVILVGRLGKDPETRFTSSGIAVCNFSVATSERYKDRDGDSKERTEWHRITAWGKLAEICGEFLEKGKLVYIEGSIETRKYTDKQGVEKYSTEIRARSMQMLSGKSEGGGGNHSHDDEYSFGDDDDIPF